MELQAPHTCVRVCGKRVPGIGFGHPHSFHWRQTQPLAAKLTLEWKVQLAEL